MLLNVSFATNLAHTFHDDKNTMNSFTSPQTGWYFFCRCRFDSFSPRSTSEVLPASQRQDFKDFKFILRNLPSLTRCELNFVAWFEVYLENSDWLFPPLLGANFHHRGAPVSQGCTTAHEMVRNDAICLSTSHGSLKDNMINMQALHIKQEVNDKATKKLVSSITKECQETMKNWLLA